MKIKKVFVTRDNPAKIFKIIEKELSKKPNTQVFVDNEIYEELHSYGLDYNVSSPNFVKGQHYMHDSDNIGGEEWLALLEGPYSYNKIIARGSFISNCNEYMQLVKFDSLKVEEYIHYLSGFEQLLLIKFKPEPES